MTVRSLRRAPAIAAIATAMTAPLAFAQSADLAVTKSGPAVAPAGSDVSYSVTVSNFGPDDAVAVTLTDPIPAGMTFVSSAPPGCSTPSVGSGGTITCPLATLPVGTSVDFTFVFHIPSGTPPGTFFTNIATATTSESTSDPNSENDSGVAVTSTPPPPQADMAVSKSGPTSAGPDTNVVFTLTITNGGPAAAASVTLSDTLPAGMTFVSLIPVSGPGMSCSTPPPGSGGTVTCTAASFAVGATQIFTLTVHVPAGTPSGTVFTNTATVSATTADPNTENNAATFALPVLSVDVSVTKSGPGTATAGTNVIYTLTLSNAGPDEASNVTLSDPLPPGTTFVSLVQGTGPPALCSTPAVGANGTVSCTFATVANGASAQFTLVIQAGNPTSIANTASATTDSFDTNAANNTSSATTAVTPSADVGVTKSGPATVAAGSNVTYTVTVTNNGPSDAANVSLTDAVAAPLAFVSLTQTSGPTFGCTTPAVGATGTMTCNIATLPVGASATFALVVTLLGIGGPGSDTVSNTATVASASSDPNPANNSSTAIVTIAAAIPTLSPFAFALLGITLAVVGFFVLRVRSPWKHTRS